MKTNYLEIYIKKKQHLTFEFLPYGFGYDYPLLIIKLFIISFYIKFPFKIKEKDSDISYGFSFNDLDQKHWFPDYLTFHLGNWSKSYDMPWSYVLFETKYDSKIQKENINIKDTNNNEKLFKYEAIIKQKNKQDIHLFYYKEIRTLKHKIFGRFINLGKKQIYVLEIEYHSPNYDLSERGLINDMIFLSCNESVEEGFDRYCKENNIIVVYNEIKESN